MILHELVARFEKQSPACVMLRATLENVFAAERLDALFESTAERQENKNLMFSTVADIMGLVAAKVHPSVHAAYQAKKAEVAVTAKALYDKLQRMEANVSREVVRETATRMVEIVRRMKGELPELLPGYRVKILDGNHLRRTQRRLQELSELNAAPLPGHCLVTLDPQLKMAIDVFPCEDAYAQERTLLPAVLETVCSRDLWIADRNFCTTEFLWGIKRRKAFFIIRQHGNALRYELIGKRKKIGRTETGVVFEQAMRLFDADGNSTTIRRITVELDKSTRDGDTEIHVLTNLPQCVTAICVAELYRDRWTIETAFQEVAQNLHGEIETLGYPRAALFAFCMALVVFNIYGVVRGALGAAHGAEKVDREVSLYYLCDEVAHTYRGMKIAIDPTYWTKHYAGLSPSRMAAALLRIARQTDLSRYRKHPRGPKKPTKKLNKTHRNHIATARVLANSSGRNH
jgi:hypothetical protein